MNSIWVFTSPVKVVHATISPNTFNQHTPSTKNYPRKLSFSKSVLTSNSKTLTIPSASSESKSSAEPITTDPVISDTSLTDSNAQNRETPPKKQALTAREKLRAARVLSRYNESKPSSKMGLGSKVLDALRESDGGKGRSGLPQAPTNLFDDSKRGMPKQGLTFDFPGGADLFFIVLSFVLITTVMFTTTYVVWKLGAIHFNEY